MNTKYIALISLLFLLTTNNLLCQNSYQLGLMPSINFNKKIEKDWSLNLRIESRQVLKSGFFNEKNRVNYNYVLTDYTLIAAKKIGLNSRIAGGYLFRFLEGEVISRFIQQFTTIKRFYQFRLSHRFVTDQTFSNNGFEEFRLRYRISTEIPLNGQSADGEEFYIRLNNEYLNSLQDSQYDLEIRIVPLLGYSLSAKNKLEMGLDYRINSFVKEGISRNSFWTTINWFITI